MSASAMPLVTFATALGCGVIGGVFFAFSTFVMKALALLPPPQGIRAMQAINVTVINGWFLGMFLGTAAASALLGVIAVTTGPATHAGLVLGGCVLYLVGTFGVTMAFNVPRNDALAEADPDTPTAVELWGRYVRGWTAFNHVRTAAALAAAALLTFTLFI